MSRSYLFSGVKECETKRAHNFLFPKSSFRIRKSYPKFTDRTVYVVSIISGKLAAAICRIVLAHSSSCTLLGELRRKATRCSKMLVPVGHCTSPHGVIFQRNGIFTVTVAKTSNLASLVFQGICIIQSWTVPASDPNTCLVTT